MALPPLGVSVKVIVLDWTASLKVAVTVVDTGTLVALLAGDSLVTLGGATSVVNDHENGEVMAMPELFSAPLTVAV